MIFKSHFIELYINGQKVELESQDSLNLRLNNVLQDVTEISSKQAEFSFSFDVPATPRNNRIFDYANNLGKLNKFNQRYSATVYADGTAIFDGTITINSYKDKKYNLNLVSVKVYSLDDIFGDSVMTEISNWKIDFEGTTTMNQYNGLINPDVTFPFVSYGVFQKSPYFSDEAANDYTSKYDLDEYNRWYIESFYPSPNMLQTVRKAFQWKGYKVGGDAFQNPFLSSIYMSTNLAEGQDPMYNVGYYKFGSVDLSVSFTSTDTVAYQQELKFPYYAVSTKESTTTYKAEEEYNYKSIDIYDVLEGSVTLNQDVCYMYQPDEHIIVIPADGFYKIDMSVSSTLNTTGSIIAAQYTRHNQAEEKLTEEDLTLTPGLTEITPVEIHLVRNYNDNIELIKGKNNTVYVNGNPNDSVAWSNYPNVQNWQTCYPHEDPYNSVLPTKENSLSSRNKTSRMGGVRNSSTNRMRGKSTRGLSVDGDRAWSYTDYGYIYNDGEIMAYDQAVSDAFICGFSSLKGGTAAVMKNGYSWSAIDSEKNESFYPEIGYSKLYRQQGTGNLITEQTSYNENDYIGSPIPRVSANERNMTGNLSCMVYLKKNDVLNLYAIQREYHTAVGNDVTYSVSTNVNLSITAASPKAYYMLRTENYSYSSSTEFDTQLNVFNFFNEETKVSDFIQNIIDAYNLDLIQSGDTIEINTKKKIGDVLIAVDIDDRANYSEAESQMIDYPRSMAVKYKIDADEWGAERSAVANAGGNESILNDEEEWKKYIDSGYTVIELNDDSYATSTSDKNLQFSYTWYQDFNWYAVNNKFVKSSTTPVRLKIPCISKYSYMIDGYDYEESMKHDGYGLAQRFWFKPRNSGCYVYTRTYPAEMIMLYEPTNLYTNYQDVYLNLSYKDTEPSILTEFFNVAAFLSSNYVLIDVYLTAEEYNRIRNGSLVHFDDDLYYIVSIEGYDPTNGNKATLKMIKKVN